MRFGGFGAIGAALLLGLLFTWSGSRPHGISGADIVWLEQSVRRVGEREAAVLPLENLRVSAIGYLLEVGEADRSGNLLLISPGEAWAEYLAPLDPNDVVWEGGEEDGDSTILRVSGSFDDLVRLLGMIDRGPGSHAIDRLEMKRSGREVILRLHVSRMEEGGER